MNTAEAIVLMGQLGNCWKCGVPCFVPSNLARSCREDGAEWFCCNGHSAVFKKTKVEKLKEQLAEKEKELAAARAERDLAERGKAVIKGKLRAQSERVKNGVCPCCNRSFRNLRRHMATKHPSWEGDE